MALPASSADVGPSLETSALIGQSQKELKEWTAEQFNTQMKRTEQELDGIKSFNLRVDQRIATIAGAALEAKNIAIAARKRAEEEDEPILTLDMEERLEALEDTMARQSQQITHAIDYHPQFIDLEDQIRKLESHMDVEFERLTGKTEDLEEDFDLLKKEVEALKEKVVALAKRTDALEKRMDALEKRMDALEKRMDALEKRMGALEKRFDALEGKVESLTAAVVSQRNFLRCREHEEINIVGKYVPGQGYLVAQEHPSFVRDFLKLVSDENVSKLTSLLAFYGTRGYEHWEDAEDLSDSSDDDLLRHTMPPNLEAAVWRFRNTAMRVLASHLGLNYDEIIRLHQARVARKQAKASKRQQSSSGKGQRQRLGKMQKRSEVPDNVEISQGASLPCRLGPHSAVPAASTTETASACSRAQGQETVEAPADDKALQATRGSSSDGMA